MIEYNTNIQLTEKQLLVDRDYICNPELTELCLYGSSRSGKSFLVAYYFIRRALTYPGSYQLFVRKTYSAIRAGLVLQTFPILFELISKLNNELHPLSFKIEGKPFVEYNGSDSLFRFYNGSEIRFAGLDTQSTNKTATDKILSTEYLTIDIEEGTEIDFEVVEKLQTRLSQQVKDHWGNYGRPKLITTLNPTTFDAWDYVYFTEGKNPKSGERYESIDNRAAVYFSVYDNISNLPADYIDKLKNLSPMERRRFLEGKHGDNFDGEIFKKLNWEYLPDLNEFDNILVYNDPSYKSGPKNDYKASVVIGRRQGAYWVIDGEAMQCTTNQMVLNNKTLAERLIEKGFQRSVVHWFENAGMPDDFTEAVQKVSELSGWVCPFRLDNRQKGDKFARIESALVPLNEQGKLFFNKELKDQKIGSLISAQFLNFKRQMQATEHDDIPDAVHGGVTLMNQPVLRLDGISVSSYKPKFTL